MHIVISPKTYIAAAMGTGILTAVAYAAVSNLDLPGPPSAPVRATTAYRVPRSSGYADYLNAADRSDDADLQYFFGWNPTAHSYTASYLTYDRSVANNPPGAQEHFSHPLNGPSFADFATGSPGTSGTGRAGIVNLAARLPAPTPASLASTTIRTTLPTAGKLQPHVTTSITPVPEPATYVLWSAGLLGLLGMTRRAWRRVPTPAR